MSTSPTGRRLVCFRLTDIDIEVRRRAVKSLVASGARPLPEMKPADLLFARLMSDREVGGDSTDVKVLRRVAENPSSKVYWVSRKAWDAVMGAPP